jgi:hypothetical protein
MSGLVPAGSIVRARSIRRDERVNLFLLGAAVLLAYVGIMHTVLAEWRGERRLVRRILDLHLFEDDREKDLLAKRIIRLAWHLTSVVWCGLAVVVAYLAFAGPSDASVAVSRILAGVFILHSLLSLILVRGKHPSCYVFFLVAASLLAGSFTG